MMISCDENQDSNLPTQNNLDKEGSNNRKEEKLSEKMSSSSKYRAIVNNYNNTDLK